MQERRVLLLRHGKSSWDSGAASDHQRPLAPRGIRASRLVGEWLAGTGLDPDLVLSSDAVRARTTVELAARAGGWACPVELRPEFYSGGVEVLLEALAAVDESVGSVLLAGHQPTWSHAVAQLVGGGSIRFPTAALACLSYTDEWLRIAPGRSELLWLVTPKLLAASR